ncbi:MAG: phosphoribosylformylglycinamidine synthase subunit PurS [Bilophila wadsworthia]
MPVSLPLPEEGTSWIIEVGYRPGVTDNEGRTARDTAALVLGIEDRSSLAVYTSIQYRLHGPLTEEQVTRIARDLLANELIQRFENRAAPVGRRPRLRPQVARVTGASCDEVNIAPLSSMSDAQLMEVSQKNTLALSLEEMTKIKNWFSSPEVAAQRRNSACPPIPPTPSSKCSPRRGRTLQAQDFRVQDFLHRQAAGTSETINSLYKPAS